MTVEIHLAERKPAKGLRKAVVPRTNEKIYLFKEVLFTNKDILDARAIEYYDHVSEKAGNRVDVVFTKDAAERMERITRNNRRKTLVILVNADVIAASTIWETIRDRIAINYEQMTKPQAERIAKSINSKCIALNTNGQVLTAASNFGIDRSRASAVPVIP